jgi:2-keto-4-pentenoate hydratase/2-oxohepta-3-ene-1,7-dioic acid hydratase in catechol pathway
MKLITYTTGEGARTGALVGETVIDLAGLGFQGSLLDLIQAGAEIWTQVGMRSRAAGVQSLPLGAVRLLAPLPRPPKVIGIGLNYMDHVREQNQPIPERPIVFAKFNTAVIGPGEAIRWDPELTQQVDFEAELGVVIGKPARNVPLERALEHVFGFVNVNDVSARDIQFGDKQWVRGKSLDTFAPMGPMIVTADEIPDPQALGIRCLVNGEVMQDSSTKEMIFGVKELVAFLSRSFTLEAGDVISTGTPDGVGAFRKPPVFLKDGDRVAVEVESLGRLENPCACG